MTCRSIFSGWRQKSSVAPVEPTLRNQSTGASEVLCSREHVLVDFNFSSAPVEPTLQNQTTGALDVLCPGTLVWVDQWTSSAPVDPMSLRSLHRCNNASVDTVSELQRLLLWHRETGWTDAHFLYRRFFRWSRFFCRKLPTAMWPPPLYIRVPPGSFQLPLTPWKPEATLEKKRKSFEQKREDLVLSLCFNLEELILCKCSKCAWARANWV